MQITGLGAKVRLKMDAAAKRKAEREFIPDATRRRKRLAKAIQRADERRANRHALRKRTEQDQTAFIVDMQSRVAAGEFAAQHPAMTANVRNMIRDGIRRQLRAKTPYDSEKDVSYAAYKANLEHAVDEEIESVMSR